MTANLETAIESVAAYLRHCQEEGTLTLDVPADLAAKLNFRTAAGRASAVPLTRKVHESQHGLSRRGAECAEKNASAISAAPAASAPPAPPPQLEWAELTQSIAACGRCSLHEQRRRPVPGQGCLNPEIMFIGEAPGEDEDIQGLAFVGPAGQLLTLMIEAMGFTREEVFIANILKCRPPLNRKPQPNEMDCCLPFLKAQIALLKPKAIVALGGTAVQGLLKIEVGITRLRGQWHTFEGIDVMPTFHPAYLLRNPSAKREVWEDLKEVLRRIGRPVPVRKNARSALTRS